MMISIGFRSQDGHMRMRSGSPVAIFAFFLMFPGFFVYHTLVGKGHIPAVMGGYSTSIAALMLPLLAAAYARHALRDRGGRSLIDAVFFLFVIYFAALVGFNLLSGADPAIGIPHLASAVQFLSIFMVVKLVDLTSRAFRVAAPAFVGLLTAIVFLNSPGGVFNVAPVDLHLSGDKVADYQGYAFVYVVLVLFFVATLRSAASRMLVYAVAVPALFLNGARSEFIAFLLVLVLTEFYRARRKDVFALAMAGLVAVMLLSVGLLVELYPENRVLLLLGFDSDGSVVERARMLRMAWETMGESPILGAYASYPEGEYAHNILSAWVDLGLFGFLLFASLLLVPAVELLRDFRARAREPFYALTLSVFAFAVLLFLSSKNFTYQMFPVAIALYSRYRRPPAIRGTVREER